MDLSKVYYDGDGNELNILQIVKLSPEWAANRIQEGEKAIANMVRLTLDKGINKMQDIENKKTDILKSIIDYIKGEDFPPEHLTAIKKIVTVFNWSEESEKKIFDFAEYISKRFSNELLGE